jgi:hypothetical protein
MSVTQFGIVYAIGSAQIRRYVYPTANNAEIDTHPLSVGEAIVHCSIGPYPNAAAWQTAVTNAVTTAAGKAPGDPRCCVIDSGGNVVSVICGDPVLDALAFPGMTLVNDLNANIGWTWSAIGGFVSPPPFTGGKP